MNLKKYIAAVACVMVLALAVSAVVYLHPSSQVGSILALSAAFLAGVLTISSFLLYWPAMRTAFSVTRSARMVVPFLAVAALAWLSIELAKQPGANYGAFNSVGTIFAVVLGIVTVLGFLLTISRLEDIHGRILDYAHLMERCEAVIQEERDRVITKRKNGKVFIMANAPGFGNVSAPYEWEAYKCELQELLGHDKVEVRLACLSWVPDGNGDCAHDRFYQTIFQRGPTLLQRVKDSKEILHKIGSSVRHGDKDQAVKRLHRLKDDVEEVPFHLLLTSDRAILFITLSYPVHNNGDRQQKRPAKWLHNLLNMRQKVQVIGFETGDRAIRDALERGFLARIETIANVESTYPYSQNDVSGEQVSPDSGRCADENKA